MPAVRLSSFGGAVPRVEPRNLTETAATEAINVRLTSGRIDPVYYQDAVAACKDEAQTIFRLPNALWLSWTEDVDVALPATAGDSTYRFYFTSDAFEPRVSNAALAGSTSPPDSWYVLGVTPPVTKLTTTPSGGSGTLESRTYVYTFVTQWGEESAPSPAATIVSGYPSGTWALSGMDVAPTNTYTISAAVWSAGVLTLTVNTTFGLRAGEYITLSGLAPASLNTTHKVASAATTTVTIALAADPGTITDQSGTATRVAPHNTTSMRKRIYRSVTVGTDTKYYYVKEIAVADTTASDDVGADIGEELPTTGWVMPPVGLRGLLALPSGAMVGFSDNRLCYSEPNSPYAWPTTYQLISDYSIVGIGAFGTAVVVGTAGTPYVAQGVTPESTTMARISELWPCLSKRGVVSFGGGVFFPTKIGLAFVSAAGPQLATAQLYSQYEWDSVNSETFHAATYNGLYYTTRTAGDTTDILVIAPSGWVTTYNITTDVLYTDPSQGRLYYVSGTDVLELEPTEGVTLPYSWKSKTFVTAVPMNIGACRIDATFSMTPAEQAAIDAANLALAPAILADTTGLFNASVFNAVTVNGQTVNPTPTPSESLQFTLYADGDVFFTKTVVDNKVFRLPAGKKYDTYAFRIAGNVPVQSIVLGETADSLRTA